MAMPDRINAPATSNSRVTSSPSSATPPMAATSGVASWTVASVASPSDGDTRFHAQLKAADPLIGYKDDVQVADMLHANWLELDRVVEMPANNLAFVAHRRA